MTMTPAPSLWSDTACPAPCCPALEGDTTADVVVVGGGYSGLSAALHLAEGGATVSLLEAEQPGFGASGRNGGQVNPGWYLDPERIVEIYGDHWAAKILELTAGACDLVFELIDRHAIDCEAVRPGYLQGVRGRHGDAVIANRIRQWRQRGAPVELLDAAAMRAATGSSAYRCGMLDLRGGNLNPLGYARGLARAAATAGVSLHGDSPARRIVRHGDRWRVETGAGSVLAAELVICTNGYTGPLWPGLSRSLVPTATVIAASEPLPPELRARILPGRHAVSETARVFYYYKLDAAGRLVIGTKGPIFSPPDAGPAERARRGALMLFPQLAEIRWTHAWGGYVAVTADMTPRLMRLDRGVTALLGYQGRGIAMATAMGREVARQLAGGETAFPVSSLRTIPLHRFRRLGVAARVYTARLLDRLAPT